MIVSEVNIGAIIVEVIAKSINNSEPNEIMNCDEVDNDTVTFVVSDSIVVIDFSVRFTIDSNNDEAPQAVGFEPSVSGLIKDFLDCVGVFL